MCADRPRAELLADLASPLREYVQTVVTLTRRRQDEIPLRRGDRHVIGGLGPDCSSVERHQRCQYPELHCPAPGVKVSSHLRRWNWPPAFTRSGARAWELG